MEVAQTEWLKAQMGATFSRRLLRIVRDITKLISAASQDQAHRFPSLAGSHLSAVSAPCCLLPALCLAADQQECSPRVAAGKQNPSRFHTHLSGSQLCSRMCRTQEAGLACGEVHRLKNCALTCCCLCAGTARQPGPGLHQGRLRGAGPGHGAGRRDWGPEAQPAEAEPHSRVLRDCTVHCEMPSCKLLCAAPLQVLHKPLWSCAVATMP